MSILGTHGAQITSWAIWSSKVLLAATLAAVASCGGGGNEGGALNAPDAVAHVQKAPAMPGPTLIPQGVSLVNTTLPGDQSVRAVGPLMDGGYTVAWLSKGEPGNTSGTYRLYLQRYDANGAKVAGETLVPFDFSAHPNPAVAVVSDGSVLLAYSASRVVSATTTEYIVRTSMFTQRYDAGGVAVGGPVEVAYVQVNEFGNPTLVALQDPSILTWTDGSYLVAWTHKEQEPPDLPALNFMAQRYDSAGATVGGQMILGYGWGAGGVTSIKFSVLPDGGFLEEVTTLDMGVQTVKFVPIDSPDRVTTVPSTGSYPMGTSLLPLINGGYVLWSTDGTGPYTKILDNSGATIAEPTIAKGAAYALADGSFVVFWNDAAAPAGEPNLTAQRFDSAGLLLGDEIPLNAQQATPLVAPLAEVGLALAWTGSSLATGLDVYTQLLQESETSWQAKVRDCRAAAALLTGANHKKFMSSCLKKP